MGWRYALDQASPKIYPSQEKSANNLSVPSCIGNEPRKGASKQPTRNGASRMPRININQYKVIKCIYHHGDSSIKQPPKTRYSVTLHNYSLILKDTRSCLCR